jgi:hypothetical protein
VQSGLLVLLLLLLLLLLQPGPCPEDPSSLKLHSAAALRTSSNPDPALCKTVPSDGGGPHVFSEYN